MAPGNFFIRNTTAYNAPDRIATRLPIMPCMDIFSRKKKIIPAKTPMLQKTSIRVGFFLYKITFSRMIKSGMVNCRTMAFAAVVILLAMVNVIFMAVMKRAPMSTLPLNLKR